MMGRLSGHSKALTLPEQPASWKREVQNSMLVLRYRMVKAAGKRVWPPRCNEPLAYNSDVSAYVEASQPKQGCHRVRLLRRSPVTIGLNTGQNVEPYDS
jgi:hypothetical protein